MQLLCCNMLDFSSLLRIVFSRNFCDGVLVCILLDLNSFVLPADFAYFLRYPDSATYVSFLI